MPEHLYETLWQRLTTTPMEQDNQPQGELSQKLKTNVPQEKEKPRSR
ncbi:hypothetical protein [Lyngbya aestuarii]